jgi:hypothetical protein
VERSCSLAGIINIVQDLGYHRGGYEQFYLLGYNAV